MVLANAWQPRGLSLSGHNPSTWALAEMKWIETSWPTDLHLHLLCVIRGDGNNGDDGGHDGELQKPTKPGRDPHGYGSRPDANDHHRCLAASFST